jgi:hypothetical protein
MIKASFCSNIKNWRNLLRHIQGLKEGALYKKLNSKGTPSDIRDECYQTCITEKIKSFMRLPQSQINNVKFTCIVRIPGLYE